MKNTLFALLLLGSATLMAQTQYQPKFRFWEAGLFFGATNYSGDLAEKSIQISETHLGYGAFVRYYWSQKWAVRANIFSGAISGDDAHAKDPDVRQRSFRFGANILEFNATAEWYPLGLLRFSDVGVHRFFAAPYVYLGLGMAFGGPKVEYYGPPEAMDQFVVAALPEGGLQQRFLLAPAGLGIRARLNEVIALGLEAGARPVFSDQLDGVRLNGNPQKGDWYYFMGANISFALSKPKKQL